MSEPAASREFVFGLTAKIVRLEAEIERLEAENEMLSKNWLATLSDYNTLLEDKTDE